MLQLLFGWSYREFKSYSQYTVVRDGERVLCEDVDPTKFHRLIQYPYGPGLLGWSGYVVSEDRDGVIPELR